MTDKVAGGLGDESGALEEGEVVLAEVVVAHKRSRLSEQTRARDAMQRVLDLGTQVVVELQREGGAERGASAG